MLKNSLSIVVTLAVLKETGGAILAQLFVDKAADSVVLLVRLVAETKDLCVKKKRALCACEWMKS